MTQETVLPTEVADEISRVLTGDNDAGSSARLAERISEEVQRSGRTVAVAESLTGGMLSAALAQASDAAEWFRGGVTAYAASVKHAVLGVPEVPVVSQAAAEAMAANVARLLDASAAVSVTGVGGPGAQDGEPAGSVWVAVAVSDEVLAFHHQFNGPPGYVCDQAIHAAVAHLLSQVEQR